MTSHKPLSISREQKKVQSATDPGTTDPLILQVKSTIMFSSASRQSRRALVRRLGRPSGGPSTSGRIPPASLAVVSSSSPSASNYSSSYPLNSSQSHQISSLSPITVTHQAHHLSIRTNSEQNGSSSEQELSRLVLADVISDIEKASRFNQGERGTPYDPKKWNADFCRQAVWQYGQILRYLSEKDDDTSDFQIQFQLEGETPEMKDLFLSSQVVSKAFHSLLRCQYPTHILSKRVRDWERYIGSLGKTTLTDDLSFELLRANGKSGNVGRAVQLLNIRKARDYPPKSHEFVLAVNSIEAAGLELRKNRNIYLNEKQQPPIDNPTRWLDAILLNMNQRGFPLSRSLANQMLNTYGSMGKTGKAVHFFHRIKRTPVDESTTEIIPGQATYRNKPVKIQMELRPPPPYQKIPSKVKGVLFRKSGTSIKMLKIDRESDPDWSPALTAAFSFCDSLAQGACGHDPVELDVVTYTTLIKTCVNRGSLWRAMFILDNIMPANDIEPDVTTYSTLLGGLSRVADVTTMRQYFDQMITKGIQPNDRTVKAITDGLLNLGDISAAVTVVQDMFNQYSILPPYTTHLKIIEYALGLGLVYEAKRYVYFIQQLYQWKRNDYHSDDFARTVRVHQNHPKLSKDALKKLFAYFGERLEDDDFL